MVSQSCVHRRSCAFFPFTFALDVSSKAAGYRVEDKATVTDTGLSIQLVLNEDTVSPTSMYGKPVEKLHVSVDYETQDRIHIKVRTKNDPNQKHEHTKIISLRC